MTNDRPNLVYEPADPPGCPAEKLSWSGLISCSQDGIVALRTAAVYAESPAFREKVDSLAECIGEMSRRLESLRCLPAVGEPSFTLLGRDPQAPARVEDWADAREAAGGLTQKDIDKLAEARRIAADMRRWSDSRRSPVTVLRGVT